MNRTFQNSMEYYPALLSLLGQIGGGPTAEVIAEFDRRFGQWIPPEHREREAKSGYIRWDNYLHWGRLLLVRIGFMQSETRGLWAITDAGRTWLEQHPDGGDWRDLKALERKIGRRSRTSGNGSGAKRPSTLSPLRQALRTAMDYRPALLWLMGEIGGTRAADAVETFDRTLGHLIPEEHRAQNRSGRPKWDEYVRWARQDLVISGFMASEQRGLWALTAQGREWLQSHPDGGGQELVEILKQRTSSGARPAISPVSLPPLPKTQPVQLHGRTYPLSAAAVLAAVRAAMAQGLPREATRFRDWFLLVDGQRVSVKWTVSLMTGLPTRDFQSSEARRVLRALGLEVSAASSVQPQEIETDDPHREIAGASPEEMDYSAFFEVIRQCVKPRLPSGLAGRGMPAHRNYIQLVIPISRSHYELRLGRAFTEIALHLEGKQEQNYRVLNELHAHVEALQQQLGERILLERWGRDHARMYVERKPHARDQTTAARLADDWLRFINVTLPVVSAIARDTDPAARRGRPAAAVSQDDLSRQRAILGDQVRTIRGFLAGNNGAMPSDEKLCEWVQFCYLFELFSEAAALFKLIRPEQVNSWLYERVKRFARASELHTTRNR